MSNHCFSFLEDSFSDICDDAMFCEKHLVEKSYKDSIIRAGIASERITIYICEFVKRDKFIIYGQRKRLEKLFYNGFIPNDIYQRLEDIRQFRNQAAHGYVINMEEKAKNAHAYLYLICVYFYQKYFDSTFSCEEYNGPKMESSLEVVEISTVSPEDDENIENISLTPQDNYPFERYNGSYLLNELLKLNVSSIEAVENDNLSEFKEYLHVDRTIQNDFLKAVKEAPDDSSHLIMLCGSVGDGKTHIIANLEKKYPDLFEKFDINYDATESYDYDKNELDTLALVLERFNDNNIDNPSKNLILAINLGVLNNFFESPQSEEFKKLYEIMEKENILKPENISYNVYGEKVTFITFSDYNMFELNSDENSNFTSSEYISALFNKITQKEEDNPFYVAYLKDNESNYISPLIFNYEMFMDEGVQKTIIDYLIKVFIKYKKIISTRDLLNFIYEIIVPPESLKIEELDDINDMMDYSLPNLLFSSPDRSDLLKLCSELDPTLYRNESLDQFIMDLNIKDNTEKILDSSFDFTKLDFLNTYKKYLIDFKNLDKNDKEKITNILIRFAIFFGNDNLKNNFKDNVYLKYLKYLYAYNTESLIGYRELFNEINDAIFNWKEQFDKKICIDVLNSFKIYKSLKLEPIPDTFEKPLTEDDDLRNRFKTEIKTYFSLNNNENKIPLSVDFSLYEYIIKLKNGFKPNKSDKEDLTVFDEFIHRLIEDSEKELYVVSLNSNEKFSFDKKFGIFEFKKEG